MKVSNISEGGFTKIIRPGSFDWGIDQWDFSSIVDDPDIFRKTASSQVVHQWGEIKPIPGHTLVHLIALGDFEKVGSNRNGDAFRSLFCQQVHNTFVKNASLYRNHKSREKLPNDEWYWNPDFKEGYVVKSAHNGDMGRTEVLVAASHAKCADWLGQMERGDPIAFSMGFNCFYDACSICDHKARSPKFYCRHTHKTASAPYGMNRVLADGRKCFVFNEAGYFNDISKVGTGADMTAFDLRKVASQADALGDEFFTGADLAEYYIRQMDAPVSEKRALAQKLSEMEKRMMAFGTILDVPEEEVDPDTVDKLASAVSPGDLFAYLSRRNVILPPRAFFKVAMQGDANDLQQDIEVASRKLASAGGGFTWAIDSGYIDHICSNATYDPKRDSTLRLSHPKEARLVMDFSVDPMISRVRETGRNLKIAAFRPSTQAVTELTAKQAALACEYLSYKLAALESINLEITPEILTSALV